MTKNQHCPDSLICPNAEKVQDSSKFGYLGYTYNLSIQGVKTQYDILWSPNWWTKINLHVLKKVAAHSGGLGVGVLSIYFQKSNIGSTASAKHISVKIWIFDDLIPKKGPVLVIVGRII